MTRVEGMRWFYRVCIYFPSIVIFVLTLISWLVKQTNDELLFVGVSFILVIFSARIGDWLYIKDWNYEFLYKSGFMPILCMGVFDISAVVITLMCMYYFVFQTDRMSIVILMSLLLSPVIHCLYLASARMILFGGYLIRNRSRVA